MSTGVGIEADFVHAGSGLTRDGFCNIFFFCVPANVKGQSLERLQGDDVTHATNGGLVFYVKGIKGGFIIKCNLIEVLSIS